MYEDLPTERVDPEGPALDLLSPPEIARLLLREEARARAAVEGAMDEIGAACTAAAAALEAGGRIVYVGAGTSGRLGVLDAAEMAPTFGADPGRVVAHLAGGAQALTESVEGAEDNREAGAAIRTLKRDCVVGITMSGTAAYVHGALAASPGRRVLITAHPDSAIPAEIRIVLDLGPEALAGSTRLKGGSATKAVLNMISTAAMAATGAVYGNLMVRVRPVNRKLRDRAVRIVAGLAGVDRARAATLLREAKDDVRVAVLIGRGIADARARLLACSGSLRKALER
ncbi:MAG: N-acetylmuramic acid 6-phosphate etherase [Planctomycetota bacterium]